MSFCLHSALFTCTTLIINALQSVDKSALCIHTTCTCQQSLYTRLHLLALPSTLLHFIYIYLHSLAFCLHLLTLTDIISVLTCIH